MQVHLTHSMHYDSYGDGWNGATYSISSTVVVIHFTYVQANNGGESPANDSTDCAGDYL